MSKNFTFEHVFLLREMPKSIRELLEMSKVLRARKDIDYVITYVSKYLPMCFREVQHGVVGISVRIVFHLSYLNYIYTYRVAHIESRWF